MPQLDRGLVRERAERLRLKGAAAFAAHLAAEQGAIRRILVEVGGMGHTEHFTPAEITGRPGAIVSARITGQTARALLAEAA
jgi:threonylcarbamoyladenosine tRNA methylthiotransferase MtaB